MENGGHCPVFGKDFRKENFMLQEDITFLNNGFKGALPKHVIDAQQQYIDETRRCPAYVFSRKKAPCWKVARDTAAKFHNANPDDVVLVPNVTTAISTILNSLKFNDGDAILTTSLTFGASQMACVRMLDKFKDGQIYTIDIEFPINNEEDVVDLFRDALVKHPNIKVAIIDYITCCAATVFPITKILEQCNAHNVISVVDGAHAPGHIDVNLGTLQADFYTANFHKWMFTPWGCALLWQNSRNSCNLKPLVSSRLQGQGRMNEFEMQGTKDESPFFTLPAAVQFFNDVGGYTRVVKYNTDLIKTATVYLTSLWHTDTLPIPSSMEAPFMRMIRLPDLAGYEEASTEAAARLIEELFDVHKIDVTIKYMNKSLYLRLSIQIYNCMEDVEKIGEAILRIKSRKTNIL